MSNVLILNVDDGESGRYIRTRILERAGFRVREAGTGTQALEMIAAERPGLVVLDVNLPDMSGHEVCRRIKAAPDTAAIPVLHISATYRDSEAHVAGLEAGADAYLSEPVESEMLVATARALLRMRQMNEDLRAEVDRRRQAEDALRASNRRLRLLSETAGELLRHDAAPEDFIATLYNRFCSELGLEVYFHFQVNEDCQRLRLRAFGGIPEELAREIEWLDIGQAVCGTVALRKQPIVVEDVQDAQDPLTELIRSLGVTAYVCHPLLAKGRLLGTLSFGTRSRIRFEPEDVDLLHTLSDQVALAYERHRLRRELLFQASLLGQVRNAVIATDLEGKIVYWNKAAESMYQWAAAEAIGKKITDVTVPPTSGPEAERIVAAVAKTGYWEGEFLVQRRDGSTFPAFVTDTAIRSAEGSLIGYAGVTVDLSEQKRVEGVLRQSELKYRRIVETAGEGVWLVDASARTTFVNGRMAAMLGYGIEELQRLTALDVVFEDDRPAALAHLERRRQGITEEYELRLRRKDGAAIWTRISASPLQDESGRFLGALRMVTDITERKRAQQAVEESQRKLRRLVESDIIGIVAADTECVLEANDVFLAMVGYSREDLASGALRWREMTPPEYLDLDRRGIEELLARGTCRTFEKEFYRKDGTRIPVLIGAVLLDEKPEWLCFVVDLTERKKAEQALRSVQHYESLGFLAGGVAHNLNNLLVGVIGNVSLVLDDAALAAGDRELLENAMSSSERAAELTSQLLAYAGKGAFVLQPVDLSALTAGVGSLLRTSIASNIALRLDLAAELPLIEADERQIRQIVTSLVMNAAEAIGERAGAIRITTRQEFDAAVRISEFAVGALMPGPHVVLEVSDTGCGMDDTTRSRIFDPFFSTKFMGRGLGLAAVAGVVRTLGGAVEVETAPGEGSTFRVYLPAAAAAKAAGE